MKTARFTDVVLQSGRPDVHLMLTDPKHDPVLQRAARANRVMTVHQPSTGSKADFGTVGLLEGVVGQILIFPKSIKAFADRNVVGIRYELLADERVPERRPWRALRARREPGPLTPRGGASKIVEFPSPRPERATDDEKVGTLKATARLALKALSEGKQVVAYQLLERILQT